VPQSYDSFAAPSVYASSFSDNLIMVIPCHGGVIKIYSKVQDSIIMSYLYKGGAVAFASTDYNGGAMPYPGTCGQDIDQGGIGMLYYNIAKQFSVGKRIGDAFREGKIQFLSSGGPKEQFNINQLYGDPTLKIKKMW